MRQTCTALAALATALFVLPGCSDEPSPFSTEAYAPSDLDVEVTAEADEGSKLTVSAEVRTPRLGNSPLKAEGVDSLVAVMGPQQTKMAWLGGFHSASVIDERDADLSVVLSRDGVQHPLPVALAHAFSVVATESKPQSLTIDLSPRPALSEQTVAIVRIEGCFESPREVVARALPITIDVSGVKHCTAKVRVDVEAHNVQPYAAGGGPLGAGSVTIKARRTARAELSVR